jgi:hypothetical protein
MKKRLNLRNLLLTGALMTSTLGLLLLMPSSDASSGSTSSPNWQTALSSAVQQLRGSHGAQFSSSLGPDSGATTGTDSKGEFQLTYTSYTTPSGPYIIGVLVDNSDLQTAFAGGSSIQETQFTLDPTTLAVTSSQTTSPQILTRTSTDETAGSSRD